MFKEEEGTVPSWCSEVVVLCCKERRWMNVARNSMREAAGDRRCPEQFDH